MRVILDSVLQFLDNLTAVRYRGVVLTRCAGGGVISARPGLQAHASMSRVHVHNWTRGGVIQMSVILDTYRHGVHVQNFCGYGLIS